MPPAPAVPAPPLLTLVIEPRPGWRALDLAELWAYRELLYFLVWRDIKVRYKQTVLGAAWAILQPLATAVVFTLFFGRLAHIASDGLPYPIFSYAGLLVWTFFAQGLTQSSASVVGSANLITKVYFPRLVIPLAAVVAGLLDLAVASPLLLVMMAYYKVWPGVAVVALPLVLLLALLTAVGVGLWLAALNVEYRDVRFVVPFLVQLWLFVTPVIYPASVVAPHIERLGVPGWVLGLNPMAGVVEGFRWAMLGHGAAPVHLIAASAAVALVLCVTGALYFRSVEREFADVV
ncbi:ABC transporter permease [Gryllotalpicola sp.]|uniref:ABC transporter permease n=1 Tax=Gryllotalpicola sp. TaxID=1932787 RepID=UPI0026250185|nr:ABC transporter permease [Gryllotalpicola sp.]